MRIINFINSGINVIIKKKKGGEISGDDVVQAHAQSQVS